MADVDESEDGKKSSLRVTILGLKTTPLQRKQYLRSVFWGGEICTMLKYEMGAKDNNSI